MSTSRPFVYEVPCEVIDDALLRLDIIFFNLVLNNATESLDDQFKTLDIVRFTFVVLLNFTVMNTQSIYNTC